MDYESLHFPLEGNVQNLAHFIDVSGKYAFTFGSPFIYTGPVELKEKEAFLLAEFNQQKKKSLSAESIFTYYINSKEKKNHPDPKVKASVREAKIYRGDGSELGSIQILLQRGMFRSYMGLNANPVYDEKGTLVGFCHFDSENHSKDVYVCDPSFQIPSNPIKSDEIAAMAFAGTVRKIFSYDLVESEEADTRDRFMAIFSPSKKSELVNNRIRYYGFDADEDRKDLLFTALFAFFWGTYVDIPIN